MNPLHVDQLFHKCDLSLFDCQSTAELCTSKTIIGQDRAIKALQFGLGIKKKGFNIFVAGIPGTGKTTAVRRFLEDAAKGEETPPDWCYVNNFRDAYQPNVIRLPAGQANQFKADMENLLKSVVREIRNTFESDEYSSHREKKINAYQLQKQEILGKLNEQAIREGFVLQATPVGIAIIPLANGKPLSEEEFMALSLSEREQINEKRTGLSSALENTLRQIRYLDKEAQETLINLDREAAQYATNPVFQEIREKYVDLKDELIYLDQVQADILDNLSFFKPDKDEEANSLASSGVSPSRISPEAFMRRFQVNVFVDNSKMNGAPVIVESNPTYANLFGRIEQEAHFGTLVTDFTLIRKGALHQANGGYLVLPIEDVLRNPFAWESLKRALTLQVIAIDDVTEKMSLGLMTKSLRPEPIPLHAKVILIGRSETYQLLMAYDGNFNELFKVKAVFDTDMTRTPAHVNEYAAFVGNLCEDDELKHLDMPALGRIIEHSSRLAGDQTKLSTRFGDIADVIREANYYAELEKSSIITVNHILKSIEERYYRSSLIQEKIRDYISRGTIKIDLDGEVVGQVNGLSVVGLGDFAFGQPNRITVSIGLGREGIIDIEREANMGGPIHTKGVLILSGYLAEHYSSDKPLSLNARIVFEQNYAGVEGDSASSTELYAILSALSELPIRQGIAVTGSVNQKGEVQAIGGVNEKIEGFFDICRVKGLTGQQGVMIPQSNVTNLMLKEDVLAAIQEEKFHVWAVNTIDEGIELLTGVEAGEKKKDGSYEEGTVHNLVDRRLQQLAHSMTDYSYPKAGS
jgi:lon-related putative ATP-dependent protease